MGTDFTVTFHVDRDMTRSEVVKWVASVGDREQVLPILREVKSCGMKMIPERDEIQDRALNGIGFDAGRNG